MEKYVKLLYSYKWSIKLQRKDTKNTRNTSKNVEMYIMMLWGLCK